MKTIKVTNLKEMSEVLGIGLNDTSSVTDLDDIDDTMYVNSSYMNMSGAITPKLPERNFNIATLTPDKLEQLRKSSN